MFMLLLAHMLCPRPSALRHTHPHTLDEVLLPLIGILKQEEGSRFSSLLNKLRKIPSVNSWYSRLKGFVLGSLAQRPLTAARVTNLTKSDSPSLLQSLLLFLSVVQTT